MTPIRNVTSVTPKADRKIKFGQSNLNCLPYPTVHRQTVNKQRRLRQAIASVVICKKTTLPTRYMEFVFVFHVYRKAEALHANRELLEKTDANMSNGHRSNPILAGAQGTCQFF
jgi:hypothetical protein